MSDKWERVPLSDEEITAIFNECKTTEDALIIAFLADTGCRVNELLRLEESWIDVRVGKYGIITVPVQATSGKRAKTKKPKTIPMTKRLAMVCSEARNSPEGVRVMRTSQHIYNVVKRLAKRAGVTKKVSPHLFRHTRACKLYYDTSMTVEEIGHYLGHANGDMVKNVYLHIDDGVVNSKLDESGVLD